MHNPLFRRTRALFSLAAILTVVSALSAGRANAGTSAAAAGRAGADISAAALAMARLDAAGGLSNAYFGSAVALDGDLLAVGASYADVNGVRDAGTVYLYARDATAPSGWAEIKKLISDKLEVGATFGQSVALHGDVLAVGAPSENIVGGSDNGVAYVFERNTGGANAWGLAKKLSGTAGQFGRFGSDVALGDDVLVVGAQNATTLNAKGGAAYLFSRAAGWSEIQRVSNVDGAIGDLFGTAVALDGDTLVVGAEQADFTFVNGNQGAAFVYQRNAGGIWELFARLVADAPATGSKFGGAVAIDGDTVVVGARQAASGGSSPIASVGAAYVFERNIGGANVWGLSRRLDPGGGAAGDDFGVSVAIASDQIWAGADIAGASGYVFRYERNLGGASIWGQAERMEQPGLLIGESFGVDVAVSGAALAVGAPGRDAGHGAVYFPGQAIPPAGSGGQVYLPIAADEALAPTGVLQPGGIVKAPTGALIGAVEGAIPAPVDVAIAATTAPAESLGSIVKPIGEYYLAGAAQLVTTPVDKPLLVGLPVPAGADPAHMAMAALTPAGLIKGAPTDTGSAWTSLQGRYDADSNLFVATSAHCCRTARRWC